MVIAMGLMPKYLLVAVLCLFMAVSNGAPTSVPATFMTTFVTDAFDIELLTTEEEAMVEATTMPLDETVPMATDDVVSTSIPLTPAKEGVWKVVKTKFTLLDKSTNDIGEPLRNEIKTAINYIFRARFDNFNSSGVIGFSVGSLVAKVELDFHKRLTTEERREVDKVLYETVERNKTLGGLRVQELYIANAEGSFERIDDACSITPCPQDMSCSSDGNECRSACDENSNYCQNGATCVEASTSQSSFVSCRCKEDFTGVRCQGDEDEYDNNGKPDLYVGIIAASAIAGIIVLAIILATCINIFNKKRIRTGRSDELFGIENVVALELSDEKSFHVDGTATQTDESFLLSRSHKDGVAPKPGHAHKIMQTNDSFLLAKSQLLRAHGSATRYRGAGSPVGVVSGNTRRLSDGPSASRQGKDKQATPSTSTGGGANGVARKASAKKDRAPPPPSTSQEKEEDTPTTASTAALEDPPKPTDDSRSQPEGQPSNDATPENVEVPPPELCKNEKPIEVTNGKPNSDGVEKVKSDIYPGRKILKV